MNFTTSMLRHTIPISYTSPRQDSINMKGLGTACELRPINLQFCGGNPGGSSPVLPYVTRTLATGRSRVCDGEQRVKIRIPFTTLMSVSDTAEMKLILVWPKLRTAFLAPMTEQI